MTIRHLCKQETQAEQALDRAVLTFADIHQTLQDGITRLQDSTDPEMRAFSGTLQLYWKTLQSIDERENNLDTLRRKRAGIADGYAIDLAQAREEVGRRLACLAAAIDD